MDTNLFFELIQVALGTREKLSRVPSAHEWEAVYEEAEKQAVVSILFYGVERLMAHDSLQSKAAEPNAGFMDHLPLELKLQWIGDVQMDKHLNKVMDQRCLELLGMLEKAGLQGTILKGQGIAILYGDLASRRQVGDIDVYVDCGIEEALTKVKGYGIKADGWDYKHAHLKIWDDTEVELHYRVEVLFDLMKNRRLQKWFNHELRELYEFDPESGFVTPSVEFNVFYILLHIYRHFFTEGVGLRQVTDYYMVLRTVNSEKRKVTSALAAVSEFGMERFARGLMWMMKEVMAMPQEWMPWEPDELEGQYILAQVMEGGNFGHYSYRQTKLTGGLGYVTRIVRHSLHLMCRYSSEALWTPVWVVWHKGWKIWKRWQLRVLL